MDHPDRKRWIEEAVEAGRIIGLEDAVIRTAFCTVFNAFGDEWLRKELPKCDPKRYGGILAGHPLIHKLRMGQPPQVSEVVELALYLTEFFEEPHFSEIVQRMKDTTHFDNAVFELAVAYRFKKVGCRCVFQPATRGGIADLHVEHGDHAWVVECSRQNPSEERSKRDALRNVLAQAVADELSRRKAAVAVRLVIRPGATHQHVKGIARKVGQLAREVEQRPWNKYEHDHPLWHSEVKTMCEAEDPIPSGPDDPCAGEWDVIAQSTRVPQDYVDRFPKDPKHPLPGKPRHRVYLRIEGETRDTVRALISKVEKKLRQTSDVLTAPPRLIIIEVLGEPRKLDWPRLQAEIGKMFASRTRFAGVSFWDRGYASGRYWYEQYLHSNDAGGYGFPIDLLAKLTELERRFIY